jgi:thiol-disulfide isomerase/thioredoxin
VNDEQSPIRAPELTGATAWLNVPEPLTLASLRGKVVLLDFWTYGCINCVHVLADLKALEAKYGDALVVIGVHSAKFTNEKDLDNLRRTLVRYEIEHPVANDEHFEIWKAYAVRAWPTRVLIDPAGYIVGSAAGEGYALAFDDAIAAVLTVFAERGELDMTPLPARLERERVADLPLAFPGKVLAVEAPGTQGRLYVADTNHHRIVIASFDGEVSDIVGSGEPGDRDGDFATAAFSFPQGLATSGSKLYVADRGNHQIREVDVFTRQVSTLAGTRRQGSAATQGGAARQTSLNAPWDVAVHDNLLFVAMAGTHQVWVIELVHALAFPHAGSGQEARLDGALDACAFAQPSGLALGSDVLYVADAESNVIRAMALPPVNEVHTVAGGDLFEFGDVDGVGGRVRLQHPLGVCVSGSHVFIADTYNHKIKVLDPGQQTVASLVGSGARGFADGEAHDAAFFEPGGLSAAGGRLFVADTNNHAIRAIDLETLRVSTITMRGLTPPPGSYLAHVDDGTPSGVLPIDRTEREFDEVLVNVDGGGELRVEVVLPPGTKLNPLSWHRYRVQVRGDANAIAFETAVAGRLEALPLLLRYRGIRAGRCEVSVLLDLFVCRETENGTCQVAAEIWKGILTLAPHMEKQVVVWRSTVTATV